MFPPPKEHRLPMRRQGERRIIEIPDDFVLEDDVVILRQEKDGVITLHPGTAKGRDVLNRHFLAWDDGR